MTHTQNAPMTRTNVDRSNEGASQVCRAEVVVSVALDGDVVLLVKRVATKLVAPNKWLLPGGAARHVRARGRSGGFGM